MKTFSLVLVASQQALGTKKATTYAKLLHKTPVKQLYKKLTSPLFFSHLSIYPMLFCVGFGLLLGLGSLGAQQQASDTLLRGYLRQLYAQNLSLRYEKAAYRQKRLADSLQAQRLVAAPRLSLGYLPWRIGAPPVQVGFSQPLLWPGEQKQFRQKQQAQAKKEALELQSAYESEALHLLQTLYKLYATQKTQKLRKEQATLLQLRENLAATNIRTQEKQALRLLNLQNQREKLAEQLARLKDEEALLRLSLALQLQLPQAQLRSPDTLYLSILDKKDFFSQFKEQNTQLRAHKQAQEARIKALAYARYGRWPNLQLQLGYLSRETRPWNNLQAPTTLKGGIRLGISLQMPLWDKRQQLNEGLAKEDIQLQGLRNLNYEDKLRLQAEATWQTYAESLRKIQLYKNLIAKSEQALALLLAHYREGQATADSHLQLQGQLLAYRIQHVAALQQGCSAASALQLLQGHGF